MITWSQSVGISCYRAVIDIEWMEGVDHVNAVGRDSSECPDQSCFHLHDNNLVGCDLSILQFKKRCFPGYSDASGTNRSCCDTERWTSGCYSEASHSHIIIV